MSKFKSHLADSAKTKELVKKIKELYALKASSLMFEKSGVRFSAADSTNVALDEAASDDNIVFRRPGGSSDEYYDLADIEEIKRLRSRKYLIVIKASADGAQATV